MATEETRQMVSPGATVTVHGKRTHTTGTFRGVGLTDDDKPRVILDVDGAAIPFAYDFDEVTRIEVDADSRPGGGVRFCERNHSHRRRRGRVDHDRCAH